jgi:hypothetical protein
MEIHVYKVEIKETFKSQAEREHVVGMHVFQEQELGCDGVKYKITRSVQMKEMTTTF